jgi:hypothetical protein
LEGNSVKNKIVGVKNEMSNFEEHEQPDGELEGGEECADPE